MKKIALMLLAAGTLVFTGCTKTGPPGPQGVQGPSGPQGPTGNANVLGSNSFDINGSQWVKVGGTYHYDLGSSDITADIADFGSVSVFILYGTTDWRPLPDIYLGNEYTTYSFYSGGFTIYVSNLDGTVPANPGTLTFRMVVISSALKQAHPNTNWKNYNEVMTALQSEKNTMSTY